MHAANPLKALVVPRDALRPPSSDNPRLGVGLSLVAHVGLVVALWLGVQWRTEDPAGVSAELWAAVPEIAAPRTEPPPQPEPEPATPPPPPRAATPPQPTPEEREAEIAIEKAKQLKLEKERREAQDQKAREKRQREEKERLEREKKEKQAAENERLAREKADAKQREKDKQEQQRKEQVAAAAREKARQDQLKRMSEQLGGTGAPGSTGTAARDAGPSANYAGRIVARIRPNITFPFDPPGNPTVDVRLVVMPDGTITKWEVVKTSGTKDWDEAVLRAVEKTAVLPRDDNGRVPSPMVLSVSRYPRP